MSLLAGGAAGSLALVGVTPGGSVRRLGHATATGIALAGAFAAGVLMLTTQPGSSKDLEAFLVGSVLTITPADVAATLVAGVILLVVLFLANKELLVTAFDPL
ncbi:MAG TPA: metal ABC transporter permease, partial [Acidimicrobiales bacterium]|nr:metal ABC transporter permease [Acidimicrobiales bacterium]